jgi:hypothetical protein
VFVFVSASTQIKHRESASSQHTPNFDFTVPSFSLFGEDVFANSESQSPSPPRSDKDRCFVPQTQEHDSPKRLPNEDDSEVVLCTPLDEMGYEGKLDEEECIEIKRNTVNNTMDSRKATPDDIIDSPDKRLKRLRKGT